MGSHPKFSIQATERNRVVSIAVRGELDLCTVPIMELQLEPYQQDGVSALLVDLREVTFLDTSGVHAFVDANDRARSNGKQFLLLGADGAVRRVLELTNTQYLLDDEDSAQLLERFVGSPASHRSDASLVRSDG